MSSKEKVIPGIRETPVGKREGDAVMYMFYAIILLLTLTLRKFTWDLYWTRFLLEIGVSYCNYPAILNLYSFSLFFIPFRNMFEKPIGVRYFFIVIFAIQFTTYWFMGVSVQNLLIIFIVSIIGDTYKSVSLLSAFVVVQVTTGMAFPFDQIF